MLNQNGRMDVSIYESRFGSVEEDFPPGAGRPRKPVRPAGRIALGLTDTMPPIGAISSEPGEHSVFEVEIGPRERSVFEVESIGGVAIVSMVPADTKLL